MAGPTIPSEQSIEEAVVVDEEAVSEAERISKRLVVIGILVATVEDVVGIMEWCLMLGIVMMVERVRRGNGVEVGVGIKRKRGVGVLNEGGIVMIIGGVRGVLTVMSVNKCLSALLVLFQKLLDLALILVSSHAGRRAIFQKHIHLLLVI